LIDDLLNKILVKDINKRINWDDYFIHSFNILQRIEININIDRDNKETKIIDNEFFNYEQLKDSILIINNEKKEDDFFLITVQIKLCYIYSIISSYLLQDFDNYVNDKNISKLSKQLFILLLKNQKLNKKNENNLLKSILLWLDDEINIKEDISEIFYLIKWEEIDDDLIFELLIKYSHIILNDDSLENFFLEIYLNKFGQNKIVESVVLKFFKAMKKIEYHKLFGRIKKDEKIIENLRTQKFKNDINLKELILTNNRRNEKNEIKKKYNSHYTQTDPDIHFHHEKESSTGNAQEKENCLIKKQDCFWNISKIKNYAKGKHIANNSKSNSFKDIIKKSNQKKLEIDKKEKKEIPKPNSKSSKMSTKIDKIKFNSISKNEDTIINPKKSIDINNIINNKSINLREKEKEHHIIKRSKSNKALNNKKKATKENINISVMKKPDVKIKEMLIFPYNFSVLKKFKNIDTSKNKSKNSHT
jgi:hypothetical protein